MLIVIDLRDEPQAFFPSVEDKPFAVQEADGREGS